MIANTEMQNEDEVILRFDGYSKRITQVKVYDGDGVLSNVYDGDDVEELIYCIPGGKVVFIHNAESGWRYNDIHDNCNIVGEGASCKIAVPSEASGLAGLCISGSYSDYYDGFYFSLSTGWIRSPKCYPKLCDVEKMSEVRLDD